MCLDAAEAVYPNADSQDGICNSFSGEIFQGPLTVETVVNVWPRSDINDSCCLVKSVTADSQDQSQENF